MLAAESPVVVIPRSMTKPTYCVSNVEWLPVLALACGMKHFLGSACLRSQRACTNVPTRVHRVSWVMESLSELNLIARTKRMFVCSLNKLFSTVLFQDPPIHQMEASVVSWKCPAAWAMSLWSPVLPEKQAELLHPSTERCVWKSGKYNSRGCSKQEQAKYVALFS